MCGHLTPARHTYAEPPGTCFVFKKILVWKIVASKVAFHLDSPFTMLPSSHSHTATHAHPGAHNTHPHTAARSLPWPPRLLRECCGCHGSRQACFGTSPHHGDSLGHRHGTSTVLPCSARGRLRLAHRSPDLVAAAFPRLGGCSPPADLSVQPL